MKSTALISLYMGDVFVHLSNKLKHSTEHNIYANLIMNITMMTEGQIYLVICIVSVIVCMVDSILLLDIRRFHKENVRNLYKPVRYISARIALGLAFLIIALMTAGLLFKATGVGQPSEKFFSIGNLVISSSQALLFTIATLALFNSKLVNMTLVIANFIPILLFVLVYFIFIEHAAIGRNVCYCFFTFYIVQLVIYTIVFVVERKKYIDTLRINCTEKEFLQCRNSGVTMIFIAALAVGLLALASYFFTQYWQLSLFVLSYTVFYTVVTVYFLSYARRSSEIESITAQDRDF